MTEAASCSKSLLRVCSVTVCADVCDCPLHTFTPTFVITHSLPPICSVYRCFLCLPLAPSPPCLQSELNNCQQAIAEATEEEQKLREEMNRQQWVPGAGRVCLEFGRAAASAWGPLVSQSMWHTARAALYVAKHVGCNC